MGTASLGSDVAIPVWLRWLLGAAMLAVTAYHLLRAIRRWRRAPGSVPLSDTWHVAMAVGMGLMALGLTRHGALWWLLAFAAPVAVLAWRTLDRYVVGGVAAAAHDLRRLVAGVAMCWMLAPVSMAMPAGSPGAAGGTGADAVPSVPGQAMAGMAMGAEPVADPAVLDGLLRSVTVLLLLAMAALAARSCGALLRPGGPGRRGPGARSARSTAPTAQAAPITPATPATPAAPTAWLGCRLAMHVTSVVMLAAMV